MSKNTKQKSKIGLRLRNAFQELGINPAFVGQKLGIPASTVYGWTQGLREPKSEVLEKIIREFNINPSYILLDEGPPILNEERKSSGELAWAPVDHVCRFCGSRIMVRRGGFSVGDVYKCFTCGKAGTTVNAICWCGQQFRASKGRDFNYRCLPTNIREKYPEVKELFDEAFRACGINPDQVEVGIVLFRDFNRIMREAEARRAVAEGGFEAVPRHEKVLADIEKALEQEKRYLGTPLAAGLHLEKLWRDYLRKGESPLFVRGLIWKILELSELLCD